MSISGIDPARGSRAAEWLHVAAPLQGRELCAAIDAALQELVGHRLLTMLRLDGPLLRRAYSSRPTQYAEGGAKDTRQDPWLRQMLAAPGPVLSPDERSVRERFPDHAAIFSIDCGAVLNLPVRSGGRTLGSVNLLHQAGWLEPRHADIATPFVDLLAAAWNAGPGPGEEGRSCE